MTKERFDRQRKDTFEKFEIQNKVICLLKIWMNWTLLSLSIK
jgi:hypothetical protein